jgi:hypothetical protein
MDMDELLSLALMKHRDGEFAEAGRLYAQILTVEPEHRTAGLNLASLAMDHGRLEEAGMILRGILARDEDDGVTRLLYSRWCFQSGRHEEGYPHVTAAFASMPEDDGVAGEFVSAMRRRWFTFDQTEYLALLELAQKGDLPDARRQRLVHLTFLRIARPELIRLLVEPGLPQDTPDAVTRWLKALPEGAQAELALLARNFAQALDLMADAPLWQPPSGRVYLRRLPGESGPDVREAAEITDADTLTGPSLEFVRNSRLQFVPFQELRRIEFGAPAPAVGAVMTRPDGREESGLMPLFYLFSEFAESDNVRQGRSTLLRPVLPGAAVGVGLRTLRIDGEPLPIVRVERIEFA